MTIIKEPHSSRGRRALAAFGSELSEEEMQMQIFSNIPALFTKNALGVSESALQKSLRRLSSGLRINSAADDAAGLGISNKMQAQIRGLDQASRNAQDGISMIRTAEGGLNESQAILHRMRELSVQAGNDTLTSVDRRYIQEEIDQLTSELGRIASTTQFNRKKLLDGSSSALWSSSSPEVSASWRFSSSRSTRRTRLKIR